MAPLVLVVYVLSHNSSSGNSAYYTICLLGFNLFHFPSFSSLWDVRHNNPSTITITSTTRSTAETRVECDTVPPNEISNIINGQVGAASTQLVLLVAGWLAFAAVEAGVAKWIS